MHENRNETVPGISANQVDKMAVLDRNDRQGGFADVKTLFCSGIHRPLLELQFPRTLQVTAL